MHRTIAEFRCAVVVGAQQAPASIRSRRRWVRLLRPYIDAADDHDDATTPPAITTPPMIRSILLISLHYARRSPRRNCAQTRSSAARSRSSSSARSVW
jgi:hypothetical protein